MERTIVNYSTRAALDFCRVRQDEAVGRFLPYPAKDSLCSSKKKILLHQLAVHFSTGTAVQFSPGTYKGYWTIHFR